MKKSKHSPGPWAVVESGDARYQLSIVAVTAGMDFRLVATTPEKTSTSETAQANARLIAASPSLYGAARNALKVMPVGPEKDALIDVLLEIEAEK